MQPLALFMSLQPLLRLTSNRVRPRPPPCSMSGTKRHADGPPSAPGDISAGDQLPKATGDPSPPAENPEPSKRNSRITKQAKQALHDHFEASKWTRNQTLPRINTDVALGAILTRYGLKRDQASRQLRVWKGKNSKTRRSASSSTQRTSPPPSPIAFR